MARKKPDPGISVRIDTRDRKTYTREEWAARPHRVIVVRCNLEPTAPGYTRQELLDLYRWYAGFIARVAITTHVMICRHNRRRMSDFDTPHTCLRDEDGLTCGIDDEPEGLYDPRASVTLTTFFDGSQAYPQSPPTVQLIVPTEDVKEWVDDIKELIADMLAADSAPLRPEASPDHTTATLSKAVEQEHTR